METIACGNDRVKFRSPPVVKWTNIYIDDKIKNKKLTTEEVNGIRTRHPLNMSLDCIRATPAPVKLVQQMLLKIYCVMFFVFILPILLMAASFAREEAFQLRSSTVSDVQLSVYSFSCFIIIMFCLSLC